MPIRFGGPVRWWTPLPQSPFRLYGLRGIVIGLTSLADGICTLATLGLWHPSWWIVVMGYELDWDRKRREREQN